MKNTDHYLLKNRTPKQWQQAVLSLPCLHIRQRAASIVCYYWVWTDTRPAMTDEEEAEIQHLLELERQDRMLPAERVQDEHLVQALMELGYSEKRAKEHGVRKR